MNLADIGTVQEEAEKQGRIKHIHDIAEQTIQDQLDRQANKDKYRPIKTGLEDLDAIIGGIKESLYVVIGGKHKSGKTSLALHIASAMACAGRGRVDYYTLEEQQSQIGIRSLTRLTQGVDRNDIYNLEVSEAGIDELKTAAHKLREECTDLWIEDSVFEADLMIAQALEDKATVVVVDYFQLLSDIGNKRNENETTRMDQISRKFIQARNTYGITFIIAYQVGDNNKAYGTRSVYRDADLIIEISPEEKGVSGRPEEGLINVRVHPSRICHGGKCQLSFSGAHSRVANVVVFNPDTGTIEEKF